LLLRLKRNSEHLRTPMLVATDMSTNMLDVEQVACAVKSDDGVTDVNETGDQLIPEGSELLVRIFGPMWISVRTQEHRNKLMYYACDIQRILGLSNITGATRGGEQGVRVEYKHRAKVLANDPSVPGKVILVNLKGVFQMILNNESDECLKIRRIISNQYLHKIDRLKLY